MAIEFQIFCDSKGHLSIFDVLALFVGSWLSIRNRRDHSSIVFILQLPSRIWARSSDAVQHGLWPAVSGSSFFSQVGPIQVLNPLGQSCHHHTIIYNSFFSQWGGAPAQEAHWTLGNQVIVYPRQLRENFLVPHSSPGSLGEMKRPSGFSIGGTCWQWRSRGGRKQEQEDPEIVFPIIVTFVCFKVKVGAIWSPLSLFAGVW